MSTKSIITLKDVYKTYQMGEVQVPALKKINLDIHKNEFVIVVGPSGSGKSTLMNMMGFLDTPTSGKILLEGRDVSEFTESEISQIRGEKIGFVFQQFNLIPTLTALENVMLPLEFQDKDTQDAKKRALELLKLVGLEDRVNHLPSQLSGGQMQRVAIARALAVDPEIIIADEPTGNLDSKIGLYIMQSLKKVHEEEGKTVIIVTHDVDLVKHAEKIVHIKDGEITKIVKNHKRRKK